MFDIFALCSLYALGIERMCRGKYGVKELWLLLICAGIWLM